MNDDKNIHGKLKRLKEDSGFRVPPNYFESLSSRINDRISFVREPLLAERNWLALLKPHMAYALLFLGVGLIGYLGYVFVSGQLPVKNLTEATISEYISYHQSPILDFELSEFVLEIENEDLFMEDEDMADIIDYLDLQEIDLYTIINEF